MSDDRAEVVDIISASAGYVIEVCGLYICKMKNGQYHVVHEQEGKVVDEQFFDNPWVAAGHFCRFRQKLKLGFDFQKKSDRITSATLDIPGSAYIG